MLMIKENLKENCDKCIIKAVCTQICREEYSRVYFILNEGYKFLNNKYDPSKGTNAINLINHFKDNDCCPMCGYKYCYVYIHNSYDSKQEKDEQHVICCLYCNFSITYSLFNKTLFCHHNYLPSFIHYKHKPKLFKKTFDNFVKLNKD